MSSMFGDARDAFRQPATARWVCMRQLVTEVRGEHGGESGRLLVNTVEVWFATREDPRGYGSPRGYGITPEEAVARLHQVSQEEPGAADVAEALRLAFEYGGIRGDHHRAWVLDQMVRALTGGRRQMPDAGIAP